MTLPTSPLAMLALGSAVVAAVMIIGYLVRRPPLRTGSKLWLFMALGVFPLGTATTGNIEGYERTKARSFCGSCHVMVPYTSDAANASSSSLAARHSRNELFGRESCYTCHADYGMYGTITTKIGGLKHVYHYWDSYRDATLEEARERIHLYEPMSNVTCMQCHSTTLDVWKRVPDHAAALFDVRENRVSCASVGCHGYAHPFSKTAKP